MKKILTCTFIAFFASFSMAPAQAHGWHRGGWGFPLATGVVIGAGIYAASNPYYYPPYGYPAQVIYQAPQTVYYQAPPSVVSTPVANPAPEAKTAYFCQATKQFYPTAPTCSVAWEQVKVY